MLKGRGWWKFMEEEGKRIVTVEKHKEMQRIYKRQMARCQMPDATPCHCPAVTLSSFTEFLTCFFYLYIESM
jgi:hypothetical protein